ncbi:uncharacterized protein LOC134721628 isoform X2 [Mytilus trossulus]
MQYLDSLMKQSSGLDICYLQLPVNPGNVSSVVNNLIITEQNNYAANETFGVLYFGSVKECILFLQEIKSSPHSIASKLMVLLASSVGKGNQLYEATRPLTNDIFLISPHQIMLQNFTRYFQNVVENSAYQHLEPWFSEYKQHICFLLQKQDCGANDIMAYYKQESQVDKSVVSLISIANALFNMQKQFCNGITGLCNEMVQNLNQMSSYMHASNVSLQTISSFYHIDDTVGFGTNILSLGKSVYDIFNLTKSNESLIGSFSNGVLNLDSNARIQESICKEKCSRCIESEKLQFGYTPGDVLILGLFSIHQDAYETSNDESKIFKCGSYRTGSTAIITVSSFLESVKSLRDPSKTGLNFGAVALDDCYNELNISALITELFTGQRILRDPKSKAQISFSKVVAVVGALSSRVTQRIADLMSSLHIPIVSYGASATTLDNRVRYPYFMRTVPSDSLQIEGMIKLISKLNVKYTGALYIDDAYGASGIEGVKELARSNGICIYKPYSIAEDTSTIKMKQILNDNRYIGGVNVIVMFSIDTIIQNILGDKVLSDDKDRNMSSYAPIFVSSEGWGTPPNLANKESAGSLVFTTDSNRQVPGSFKDYLSSLKVSTKTENPWLDRFWEEHLKCYMPRSFEKLSEWTSRCNMNAKLNDEVIKSLVSDQRNIHTEIAVYAIGLAYKSFNGKSVCRTSGNCFKRNKENASNWTEAIRSITIPLSDLTNFRPFKPDGNGNLGFTIHNIQKNSSSSFSYVKVGSYDGTLSLQTQDLKFYDHLGQERTLNPISCPTSKCPDACITTTIPAETSTVSAISNVQTSTDIIAIVLGAVAGILFLIVIMLTILVFKALRTNNNTAMDDKSKELQMDHLSVPIHHRSNRSLNGIYNEPYSQHSSVSDLRRVHHNKGFHSDNESAGHPPPSTSSGIVAGSSSDSAGSHIVYSDMAQAVPRPNEGLNYLSPESSDVSNQSLKDLTKRVLQPQSNQGIQNQEPRTDSSMTYLSANELLLDDEEESNVNTNDSPYDFGDPEKLGVAPIPPGLDPTDKENIAPPAYSLSGYNQGIRRPQTLPGISPLQLRPQEISNTGYPSPSAHCNLYTNDMYLKPVSDALPTYQQHLEQKQQFQNGRAHHVEMPTNMSPNCYNNVRLFRPNSQQNGTAQLPVLSPFTEQVYFTSNNSLSPSSRFGSPGSSIISLSPAQKEELLSRILHENPSYFHNQCNINYRSPGSSVNSPQSNNAMSPNGKLKQVVEPISVDTGIHGAIEIEDREEVMI